MVLGGSNFSFLGGFILTSLSPFLRLPPTQKQILDYDNHFHFCGTHYFNHRSLIFCSTVSSYNVALLISTNTDSVTCYQNGECLISGGPLKACCHYSTILHSAIDKTFPFSSSLTCERIGKLLLHDLAQQFHCSGSVSNRAHPPGCPQATDMEDVFPPTPTACSHYQQVAICTKMMSTE